MASPSHPDLRDAERQFTRSVLAGLWRGPGYVEALGLHIQLLESELSRVALSVGPELIGLSPPPTSSSG